MSVLTSVVLQVRRQIKRPHSAYERFRFAASAGNVSGETVAHSAGAR